MIFFANQYFLAENYYLIVPHLPGAGVNAGREYNMKLSEAKQILKDRGYRLLKESEGYTFRITGGKVTELLTGGKYQKTLIL